MSDTKTVTVYHIGDGRPFTVVTGVTRVRFKNGSLMLTVGSGNKYTFILKNTVYVQEIWDEETT